MPSKTKKRSKPAKTPGMSLPVDPSTTASTMPFIPYSLPPNPDMPAMPTNGMEDETGLTKAEMLGAVLLGAVIAKRGKASKTDVRNAKLYARQLLSKS